jgi:hypothetical protein
MQRTIAHAAFGTALLLPFFLGCNHTPVIRDRGGPPPAGPNAKPDVPALVNYLNLNAQKVQSVRAKVDIDCKQGRQAAGLGGMLACVKPLDFRLKADVLGKPAVDIGSNKEEFWYWISQAPGPYVYHCSYRDLSTGKVNLPFPFQPDMVVAALGIAEYDPNAKYELKEYPKAVALIQDATGPTGQKVKRITVFNRFQAAPGQPQVLEHVLQDLRGKVICRATVQRVTVDRATNATIPTTVTIQWPEQELTMKLMLSDVRTNVVDQASAARLFQRGDLTAHESFDLARGVVDTPGGVRRAGASVLPRR